MAKLSFQGINQYEKMIGELGASVEKMTRYAIYPAAGMVLDELKAATPVDTGDLRDSEILTKFYDTSDGGTYTSVAFDGYDRNGTPNSLKARAIESGTSRMPKQPFIRPTMRRVKSKAIDMMQASLDEYIQNKMEGK